MSQRGKAAAQCRHSITSLLTVMFTVKATYRSETRKFSFPFSTFPSYTQLNDQVLPSLSSPFSSLTHSSSFPAYFRLAHPIILLASFSPSLLVLLLPVFSLVWKLIQRKSTNSTFVPSVVASGQMVSFVSPCMTMRAMSHPRKLGTVFLPNRIVKTS
jgi:hypothetical protein